MRTITTLFIALYLSTSYTQAVSDLTASITHAFSQSCSDGEIDLTIEGGFPP